MVGQCREEEEEGEGEGKGKWAKEVLEGWVRENKVLDGGNLKKEVEVDVEVEVEVAVAAAAAAVDQLTMKKKRPSPWRVSSRRMCEWRGF